jgi:hypothetical protein
MSQILSSASKTERVGLEHTILSDGDGDIPGSKGRTEVADKEGKFKRGDSEGMKLEWERFYAELEIWRQKRYENLVENLKGTLPHIEPPPRKDKDWRYLTLNRPRDILLGTAPPVPPGGWSIVTREEVIEKQKAEEKEKERRLLEKEPDVQQPEPDQYQPNSN